MMPAVSEHQGGWFEPQARGSGVLAVLAALVTPPIALADAHRPADRELRSPARGREWMPRRGVRVYLGAAWEMPGEDRAHSRPDERIARSYDMHGPIGPGQSRNMWLLRSLVSDAAAAEIGRQGPRRRPLPSLPRHGRMRTVRPGDTWKSGTEICSDLAPATRLATQGGTIPATQAPISAPDAISWPLPAIS